MDVEIWGIPDWPELKILAIKTRIVSEVKFLTKKEEIRVYLPCDRLRSLSREIHVKILCELSYQGPRQLLVSNIKKAVKEHSSDINVKCMLVEENVLAKC